mmetsp:Transcript_10512/g.30287  ORF Transcript_10512/g.30287 Transcript_10512/m.30287 type:complete len:564 (-) Transcript_10512:275-1966(-)
MRREEKRQEKRRAPPPTCPAEAMSVGPSIHAQERPICRATGRLQVLLEVEIIVVLLDLIQQRFVELERRVLQEEVDESVLCPLASVLNRVILVLGREQQQGRIRTDLHFGDFVSRGIDLGDGDGGHTGDLLGELLVDWLQLTTVTAPWRIEFDEYVFVGVLDDPLERAAHYRCHGTQSVVVWHWLGLHEWREGACLEVKDELPQQRLSHGPAVTVLERRVVVSVSRWIESDDAHGRIHLLIGTNQLEQPLLVRLRGPRDGEQQRPPEVGGDPPDHLGHWLVLLVIAPLPQIHEYGPAVLEQPLGVVAGEGHQGGEAHRRDEDIQLVVVGEVPVVHDDLLLTHLVMGRYHEDERRVAPRQVVSRLERVGEVGVVGVQKEHVVVVAGDPSEVGLVVSRRIDEDDREVAVADQAVHLALSRYVVLLLQLTIDPVDDLVDAPPAVVLVDAAVREELESGVLVHTILLSHHEVPGAVDLDQLDGRVVHGQLLRRLVVVGEQHAGPVAPGRVKHHHHIGTLLDVLVKIRLGHLHRHRTLRLTTTHRQRGAAQQQHQEGCGKGGRKPRHS